MYEELTRNIQNFERAADKYRENNLLHQAAKSQFWADSFRAELEMRQRLERIHESIPRRREENS